MRILIIAGMFIISISLTGNVTVQAGQEIKSTTWNFDSDSINSSPLGFEFERTGKGSPGRWIVLAEKDAPSGPNVLVQVDADTTDNRFPIARGDHLEIYWDGKKVIDAHDTTFRDAGKIGLWTKADSVTYFDYLSLEPPGP